MSQLAYRANLGAKVFPFIAEFFGRTVIVAGQDQNFSRQLGSTEDLDKDRGIPQLYYCHNVMPTAQGFQSIGYNKPVIDIKTGFTGIFILRDTNGNEVFYSHAADGRNYVLPFGGAVWIQLNTIAGTVGVKVTTATVNGQTYVFFASVGLFLYDVATSNLIAVTMLGVDTSFVTGITSSAGYMIAWTDNSIAWSSTVAPSTLGPIDFVPSLITGAGGGSVEAAKGKITLCLPHFLGFIIYTTDNAVAAVYSGNSRFPFNLREIVGSGGLSNASLISFDSSSGNHYAYTTSGLQVISVSGTQTIFPEITDFVAGRYFEDFNESTLKLLRTTLTAPMKKAINVISDRYLVVSYGITSLTHALVFDLVQKRFGKLRIPHVCAFEFKLLGPEVTETPRASLGFLDANGSISVVDFTYTSVTSNGVMLLGKYQYVRTRLLQLQEVALENVIAGSTFELYNFATVDGKNFGTAVPGSLVEFAPNFRRYNFRQTGVNHTLLFKGNFFLDSLSLKFNIHGRR